MKRVLAAAGLILLLAAAARTVPAGPGLQEEDPGPVKRIEVPGNAGWVDTGIDVDEGQEFLFVAEGRISLQKGNPEAECGPEGYDIQGIQQPLPDSNLGCLAGRVAQLLAVRTDEKTGEEVRDELVRFFYIGRERTAAMPVQGRLYLGVNENVVKDNDGAFTVTLYRKSD